MTGAPARLAARLAAAVRERAEFRDELTLVVSREDLLEALQAARAEGFVMLTDLTAVDRHPARPRFEVVYLLTALDPPARVRLKVRVEADDATVPSATGLWPGASWLEREVYDLFGIVFIGHPDLRRILLPDDWEGHPLRKDYPLVEEPVQFRGHTPKVPSQIIPRVPPGQ
ncbi:MAG: NADH-quinone oxidoreductase subunit C [Armatimonadota bacterium]|nr:NADH-quinone oxidoreductase subunit C [Armatimonadota bacterium]MDR7402501.1 NADH-quinone oxidoreductase subunit C [Armatimonadota bacterium]MDR7403721.1 NADH-quinone oxidoreductase subunit C [Armatimonadota bacterium]MDR7436110.1 NADH-quinone oxidoreductase subunit C [Armatimonadota bacterium]MDR7471989.1 NADH-quinone oxidoreductase subunit C [Armatimonadota bacterium]